MVLSLCYPLCYGSAGASASLPLPLLSHSLSLWFSILWLPKVKNPGAIWTWNFYISFPLGSLKSWQVFLKTESVTLTLLSYICTQFLAHNNYLVSAHSSPVSYLPLWHIRILPICWLASGVACPQPIFRSANGAMTNQSHFSSNWSPSNSFIWPLAGNHSEEINVPNPLVTFRHKPIWATN